MPYVNEHYLKLAAGYLFPEIARRVAAFSEANPKKKVIRMGIGDVTEPLPPAVIAAMHRAVDDQARRDSFHGYGPSEGYPWLREKIAKHDFAARGCEITADEIFVSDGSKGDCGNILDILGPGNSIAVADPVYPVYVDTNVMYGNTGGLRADGGYQGLHYLPATAENGFVPELPREPVDVIYLCFPNNPTGAVATRDVLRQWVEYANEYGSLILFDAAYEAYITDPAIPHSIYEIDGARRCAIEFRSFSKTAGFTGVRCAATVVPKDVAGRTRHGEKVYLHRLWQRRQNTKTNGVSYIVQRGAEAAYSDEGRQQIRELVSFYLANAAEARKGLEEVGLMVFGGTNAPYVWARCPSDVDSWSFFDLLLSKCAVVCTPGLGFGASGEGYVRFSAFNSRENVVEAMKRVSSELVKA